MDQSVQIWREGRAGRIRLNRPKALNALDAEMVALMRAALAQFEADPAVHLVLVDAPERGFCAGGDIRTLRAGAMAGDVDAVAAFFAEEYRLNLAIANFSKPYVTLIDGVCMGGGIGISVHAATALRAKRRCSPCRRRRLRCSRMWGPAMFCPACRGRLACIWG